MRIPALLGFAFLALVLGTSPARSLDDAEAAPTAVALEPIPVSDILSRATETLTELRSMTSELPSLPQLREHEEEYERSHEDLEAKLRADRLQLASVRRITTLQQMETTWQARLRRLTDARQRAGAITDSLDRLGSHLADIEERWTVSAKHASEKGAPPEIEERIHEVRERLAELRDRIESRRSISLQLQAKAGRLADLATTMLEEIHARRAEARSQLLVQSEAPFWGLFHELPAREADLEPRHEVEFETEFELVELFVESQSAELALQVLLAAAACLLLRSMRTRIQSLDDPEVDAAMWVTRHPWSSSLLVYLLLVYFMNTTLPALVQRAVVVGMVLTVLRLIPVIYAPGTRGPIYALSAFAVADRLRSIVAPSPLVDRVVLELEIVVALAALLWLLRPSRLQKIAEIPSWLPLVGPLLRVATLLLAVSLGASVLGFTSLCDYLSDAVLIISYAAAVFYAGYRIVRASMRLALRSHLLQKLNLVRRHRQLVQYRLGLAIKWTFIGAWGVMIFDAFDIRRESADLLARLLGAQLEVGELALSLGDVVFVAITLTATVYAARFVRFVMGEDVTPRLKLAPGVPYAISASSQYVVLALGFMAAIAAGGVDLSRFAVLAGALGVGVGFGLQNVVNNFVCGVILLFERPVRAGDVIEVGEIWGTVRRIGIRSSSIRTFQGAEVVVPNADLISEKVTNWTLSDRQRRVDVLVGVKYGTNPERVIEILNQVASEDQRVGPHPPPIALFVGFGESSLDFQLRVWTPHYEDWIELNSALNVAVNRALKDANIEIPFPQRDLHLRSVDPEAGARLGAPRAEEG